MLTIPNSIKTLFMTDGARKNFRVHFPNGEMSDITNDNIVRESLHFTESICSQDVFKFGLAEASVIEFETVGISNMYGMTIECSIEIDTSSLSAADISSIQSGTWDGTLVLSGDSDIGYGFFRVPLGVFMVASCPRNHGAMTHRKVTAYSIAKLPPGSIPGIPTTMAWESITVSPSALIALATGDGMTQIADAPAPTKILNECDFWDSNGTLYSVSFAKSGLTTGITKMVAINRSTQITDGADFCRIPISYDADAYRAQGEAIVEKFNTNGYDLTYDKNGVQIFSSNREALETRFPHIFSPVLTYVLNLYDKPSGGYIFVEGSSGGGYVTVPSGDNIFPVSVGDNINPYFVGTNPRAFVLTTKAYVGANQPNPSTQEIRYANGISLYYIDLESVGNGYIRIESNGATWGWTFPVTEVIGDVTVERYQVATTQPISIMNKGTGTPVKSAMGNNIHATKAWTPYLFAEAFNYYDATQGALEIYGLFAKDDRSGKFEAISLDPSSPVSVSPDDYSEVWWDEFNVSPIGTVTVAFQNNGEQATANIVIGSGLSVYDMTQNAVLQNLASADEASILSTLSGNFLTNAANAGFTPVEMTMMGMPWVEAGDALEITAEDGTVVETYALRVEMNGIQFLQMSVVSQGGEIIGETS